MENQGKLTQDTRQTKQNTTKYVLDTSMHKTQDENKRNETQQNMCWTPAYTRHKAKTNKTKHNTICVEHHYKQANTNNVDKTRVLLQTTGGKDDPNIGYMRKSCRFIKS